MRVPRSLLRWAQTFAVEIDISDQELAVRVFDSYLRTDRYPPNKEDVRRDRMGFLVVPEQLLALNLELSSSEQILKALEILVERHTKLGGPLGFASAKAKSARRLDGAPSAARPGRSD